MLVARDGVAQPLGAGLRAEEAEEVGERQPLAVRERHRLELAVLAVELRDLAAVADHDPRPLEVADQVVRHRLAEVGAAVEQRHQRAPAASQIAACAAELPPPTTPTRWAAAELRLRRAGGIEHGQALVVLEPVDRQAAVVGAGGDDDRPRRHLAVLVQRRRAGRRRVRATSAR